MNFPRTHLLSLVSFTALVVALALPFMSFGLRFSPGNAFAVLLLGSAFVVLFVGHFLVRTAWKRHLILALVNAPLLLAWSFAATLMWYFQPGVVGAMVLGIFLSAPAILIVFVLRRQGRRAAF